MCSATQDTSRLLEDLKVYYRCHKNMPMDPILGWINPFRTLIPFFGFILILSSPLPLCLVCDILPLEFRLKYFMHFLSLPTLRTLS
jgi:hypothetical protein